VYESVLSITQTMTSFWTSQVGSAYESTSTGRIETVGGALGGAGGAGDAGWGNSDGSRMTTVHTPAAATTPAGQTGSAWTRLGTGTPAAATAPLPIVGTIGGPIAGTAGAAASNGWVTATPVGALGPNATPVGQAGIVFGAASPRVSARSGLAVIVAIALGGAGRWMVEV
jgi:hypothetical protein